MSCSSNNIQGYKEFVNNWNDCKINFTIVIDKIVDPLYNIEVCPYTHTGGIIKENSNYHIKLMEIYCKIRFIGDIVGLDNNNIIQELDEYNKEGVNIIDEASKEETNLEHVKITIDAMCQEELETIDNSQTHDALINYCNAIKNTNVEFSNIDNKNELTTIKNSLQEKNSNNKLQRITWDSWYKNIMKNFLHRLLRILYHKFWSFIFNVYKHTKDSTRLQKYKNFVTDKEIDLSIENTTIYLGDSYPELKLEGDATKIELTTFEDKFNYLLQIKKFLTDNFTDFSNNSQGIISDSSCSDNFSSYIIDYTNTIHNLHSKITNIISNIEEVIREKIIGLGNSYTGANTRLADNKRVFDRLMNDISSKKNVVATRDRMLQLSQERNVYKQKVMNILISSLVAIIIMIIFSYTLFSKK